MRSPTDSGFASSNRMRSPKINAMQATISQLQSKELNLRTKLNDKDIALAAAEKGLARTQE